MHIVDIPFKNKAIDPPVRMRHQLHHMVLKLCLLQNTCTTYNMSLNSIEEQRQLNDLASSDIGLLISPSLCFTYRCHILQISNVS